MQYADNMFQGTRLCYGKSNVVCAKIAQETIIVGNLYLITQVIKKHPTLFLYFLLFCSLAVLAEESLTEDPFKHRVNPSLDG